uniref:Histone domain-containing protein n=1 Tax=Strongyloides venezuelensis TaxID=75913 RepID=A0A0K0F7D2_STRVS
MAPRRRSRNSQLGIIRPICRKRTLQKVERSLKILYKNQERVTRFLSLLPLQCIIQNTWPSTFMRISSSVVFCALSIIPFIKKYLI